MGDFCMPSLGADMEAGRLVEWHVGPGDRVRRGQVIALVETQKGIIEVEVWEDGVIEALVAAPGAKVPVGAVLARIGDGTAARPAAPPTAMPAAVAPAPPREAPFPAAAPIPAPAPAARPGPTEPGRIPASPAARQLARELEVDIAAVHGTGPHGVITRDDVARAGVSRPSPGPAERPAPRPAPPADGMRQAIAAAMARSKREIPHYYVGTEIDVHRAVAWLREVNAKRAPEARLLMAALFVRATALAARAYPETNGFFTDGAFRPSSEVHVGVAISLRGGGLLAPAILDADGKSVDAIMADLADLATRARAGRLRAREMSAPTITVTNLGDQGVLSVFGVIHPPQVALVGFGRVTERAWAEDGMVGSRPVVVATLSADHRASDGHRGALFLNALADKLREPERL